MFGGTAGRRSRAVRGRLVAVRRQLPCPARPPGGRVRGARGRRPQPDRRRRQPSGGVAQGRPEGWAGGGGGGQGYPSPPRRAGRRDLSDERPKRLAVPDADARPKHLRAQAVCPALQVGRGGDTVGGGRPARGDDAALRRGRLPPLAGRRLLRHDHSLRVGHPGPWRRRRLRGRADTELCASYTMCCTRCCGGGGREGQGPAAGGRALRARAGWGLDCRPGGGGTGRVRAGARLGGLRAADPWAGVGGGAHTGPARPCHPDRRQGRRQGGGGGDDGADAGVCRGAGRPGGAGDGRGRARGRAL